MIVRPMTATGAAPTHTRAQQAIDTRARLVRAAARLFAERGYAGTSVAAIGAEAGVSRGLVNFHFGTKENLLSAVITDLVSDWERNMFPADATAATPLEAVRVLFDAHRRFVVQERDRARLLFRLQAEALNPELGLSAFVELHDRWLTLTSAWWHAAVASGEVDPTLDHNAVATFVIGGLRGIALEWLMAPESVDVDAAYEQLWRAFERSVRA
jgi:AcrR family transcriptional regulator